MAPPVIYVDHSDVRPGRREELGAAVRDRASFVETQEPRALAYQVYFDASGTQMTVLHVHPDVASLALHLDVAGPRFARFRDLVRLRRIEVYGSIGADLVARLEEKARLLGGTVVVNRLEAGFARFRKGAAGN